METPSTFRMACELFQSGHEASATRRAEAVAWGQPLAGERNLVGGLPNALAKKE